VSSDRSVEKLRYPVADELHNALGVYSRCPYRHFSHNVQDQVCDAPFLVPSLGAQSIVPVLMRICHKRKLKEVAHDSLFYTVWKLLELLFRAFINGPMA